MTEVPRIYAVGLLVCGSSDVDVEEGTSVCLETLACLLSMTIFQ